MSERSCVRSPISATATVASETSKASISVRYPFAISELGVHAEAHNVDRPAHRVITGIVNVLIVERQMDARNEGRAVIEFQNFLEPRPRELTVADDEAETAGSEIVTGVL